MPTTIKCPHCRAALAVPDEYRGKKVRCRGCSETFTASTEEELDEVQPVREEPRVQANPRPRLSSGEGRQRYEDEDDDDRPVRRRRGAQRSSGGLPIGLLVAGGVVLLLLLVGGALAPILLFRSSAAPVMAPPVAVANAPAMADAPAAVAPEAVRPALQYRWEGTPHVYSVRADVEREEHFDVQEGNCVITSRGPEGAGVYKLTCNAPLARRQMSKRGGLFPGMVGIPRFPPPFVGASQIEADATGRVIRAEGGSQLPALLGEVGVFLIDRLPTDGRATWEVPGTCSIETSTGGPFPFGPRFGPRGGPFGPGMGGAAKATREGQEKSVYTLGATAGDTVSIQKRYELKVPAAGNESAIDLTGESSLVFDVKLGVPRSIEFKGTLTTGTQRLPVTVTCRLLEGEARDRVLNPPAVKVEQKPPPQDSPAKEDEVTKALADLRNPNQGRRRIALGLLAKSKPAGIDADQQEKVRKALHEVLGDADQFTRPACMQALAVWGNGETVDLLLPMLGDADVFTRWEVISTLGKLGDERAAAPIAKHLAIPQDRMKANQALVALGINAEKAVLPYLANEDWVVRLEACRILKVVGAAGSKAGLLKAARDTNGLVAKEAKSALAAVSKRP